MYHTWRVQEIMSKPSKFLDAWNLFCPSHEMFILEVPLQPFNFCKINNISLNNEDCYIGGIFPAAVRLFIG